MAGAARCPVPTAILPGRRPKPGASVPIVAPPRRPGSAAAATIAAFGVVAAAVAIPWLLNVLRTPELSSRTRHRLLPVRPADAPLPAGE